MKNIEIYYPLNVVSRESKSFSIAISKYLRRCSHDDHHESRCSNHRFSVEVFKSEVVAAQAIKFKVEK